MKKIAFLSVLLVSMLAAFGQSYNGTVLVSGGTNNIAATTTNQAYGPLLCVQSANVFLQVRARLDADTVETNILFSVFESYDQTGTNLSTAKFDYAVLPANNTAWGVTNVNLAIGAAPYLYIKFTNPNLKAVTNLTVKYGVIKGL